MTSFLQTIYSKQISLFFKINQLYGLYFYDKIENQNVDFLTMIDFILSCKDMDELSSRMDEGTVSQSSALSSKIQQFNAKMDMLMDKTNLKGYFYQNYNVLLNDEDLAQIYKGYYLSSGEEEKDTIPFLPFVNFLIQSKKKTDEASIATMKSYVTLYKTIHDRYSIRCSFLVTYALTNQTADIKVNEETIQQLYILYFYKTDSLKE